MWDNTNKRLGIALSAPLARLHIDGTYTDPGNVLFSQTGAINTNLATPPVSGSGSRMMWMPSRAAFRVGYVTDNQWNNGYLGKYSFASGNSTIASGDFSTAMGWNTRALGDATFSTGDSTTASGHRSAAFGQKTQANGNRAVAFGQSTIANGDNALSAGWGSVAGGFASSAFGIGTTASGQYSFAAGRYMSAPSYCEFVIGSYNTTYNPTSTSGWSISDRLFVIGMGFNEGDRKDALTVYKNGQVVVEKSIKIDNNRAVLCSYDNVTRKVETLTVNVNTTLAGNATTSISFTFPETFNSIPSVWIGESTGSGFAEIMCSIANVTSTGAKLFIFNPRGVSQSPNFQIKIIAMGGM
jgi:hypothetical protein